MNRSLLLYILVLAMGCAVAPTPLPEPQSEQARLYSSRCGACHSVPHPKRHSYAQWEHMLTLMESEMRHKGMAPLNKDVSDTILDYLRRNSR